MTLPLPKIMFSSLKLVQKLFQIFFALSVIKQIFQKKFCLLEWRMSVCGRMG